MGAKGRGCLYSVGRLPRVAAEMATLAAVTALSAAGARPQSASPNPPPLARFSSEATPRPLTQPVLSYSTYLGGSGFDFATGVAVDAEGSVYVTGYTNSTDSPPSGLGLERRGGGTCGSGLDTYPCFDIFVIKLDPTGHNLVYAALFGGSGDDYPTAIAIDSSGNAYITGYTNSLDFPTSNAAQARPGGGSRGSELIPTPCFDAFLAKLDAAGSSLAYSTYLGGGSDDFGEGISVNAAGSATVVGFTTSPDFPAQGALFASPAGGYDTFVVKLAPSGALAFATSLGGTGDDFAAAVAADASGDIYLTGYTNSADFPVVSAVQGAYSGGTCGALSSRSPCTDAFVVKLRADGGRLEYSTYLGGTGGDYGFGIALDAARSAYVTGLTTSADFPVTYGAFQVSSGGSNTDGFIAKLGPTGSSLDYSTYLGGIGSEAAYGVAVDANGRAYVTGYVYGSGLPLVNAVQATSGGFADAFLLRLNDSGTALEFSTYLGGSGNEKARAVARDVFGNIFMVGETFSTDFPTVRAFQPNYGGGAFDAFVAKIAGGDAPVIYASPSRLELGSQRVGTSSASATITLTNIGAGELNLVSLVASGDFSESHGCSEPLVPGGSCDVAMVFTPAATGPRAGTLMITYGPTSQTLPIALSGNGIAPEITLSASDVVFGKQLVGTKSLPQVITVTNTGTASLELSAIAVTGEFNETHDCGGGIDIGAGCKVEITFAPTTAGARSGTLVIAGSVPPMSRLATLSGTGTDFALAGTPAEASITAGQTASYTLTITPSGGFAEQVALACTGVPAGAQCSVLPASLALDGVNAASAQVSITTTRRSAATPSTSLLPRRFDLQGPPLQQALRWLITVFFWFGATMLTQAHRRERKWALLFMMVILLVCGGCGGGSPPPPSGGTPAGSYTVTLTGTCDGVSRSTTVRLTVQ